jgi:hypothetical protein
LSLINLPQIWRESWIKVFGNYYLELRSEGSAFAAARRCGLKDGAIFRLGMERNGVGGESTGYPSLNCRWLARQTPRPCELGVSPGLQGFQDLIKIGGMSSYLIHNSHGSFMKLKNGCQWRTTCQRGGEDRGGRCFCLARGQGLEDCELG